MLAMQLKCCYSYCINNASTNENQMKLTKAQKLVNYVTGNTYTIERLQLVAESQCMVMKGSHTKAEYIFSDGSKVTINPSIENGFSVAV